MRWRQLEERGTLFSHSEHVGVPYAMYIFKRTKKKKKLNHEGRGEGKNTKAIFFF